MKKVNNIKLLNISLKSPEPIIDEFYIKSGNIIISNNPKNPTELMKKNNALLESISAYNFAKNNKNKAMIEKATEKILEIVKNKNINYSEFVSFWPVVDISYSLFSKLNNKDQFEIIRNIADKYIELRHCIYLSYGYSPTTLQVGKDAKAHKESGSLGLNKVAKILDQAGYQKANHFLLEDFICQGSKKYIESDKKGKRLFKDLLKCYKIKFSWSKSKEQKMPDFLIRSGKDIFIVEHKHMKEGGGGQDKQINEVISFISFSENNPNMHYVSFLDGIYFNLFTNKKYLIKGKIFNQLNNITKNLKQNPQNYFVNTKGFMELIKNIN